MQVDEISNGRGIGTDFLGDSPASSGGGTVPSFAGVGCGGADPEAVLTSLLMVGFYCGSNWCESY